VRSAHAAAIRLVLRPDRSRKHAIRIVIVGAGVAGSILARSLSRLDGADVICLERVGAEEHHESGTGLNIGPNGVKALTAHAPEVARQIAEASFPWRRWKVSLTDGTVLFDLPLARVADHDGWRIRWSELYRLLRQAAAPAIVYGSTIARVTPSEGNAGRTCIAWTDASGAERRLGDVDLLVAADGRYSEVRLALAGAPVVRHVGVAISRVLVPDTSGGLIDEYEQWFNGPNRLLGFRVPPDHVYATCAFPIPADAPIPKGLKRPDAIRRLFSPPSGTLSPSAQWMLETICTHAGELHWARMQEHDLLYADPHHNALYLGDAAHGMVPTLAQGATQAIEDATVASDIIAQQWARGSRDPRRWLRLIAGARLERMRFAMRFSLEATDTMLSEPAGDGPLAATVARDTDVGRERSDTVAGADSVAGSLQQRHQEKSEPAFLSKLRRLYCDVAGGGGPTGGMRPPTEG
jgi:salicylate hydroxylase